MKLNLKEELEAGAEAYDKLLEDDWRLKLEEEYTERILQEKEAAKRKKQHDEELEKKKQKKHSKRKKRRLTSGFSR